MLFRSNDNYYSEMRWDGGGDDGADGGDDVDDDPDDARRDGDDDDGDSPPPGGKFPGRFLPAGALLLSVWFSLRGGGGKIIWSIPLMFLCQWEVIRRRGAGGGHRDQGRAPHAARGGPTAGGAPAPGAPLHAPFRLRDLFFIILSS